MTTDTATSTGHAMADASWLDAHFESARAEYEASLRDVGIQSGWAVLDAGCGNGGFVPLMCELVGATGEVTALDLAPENVAHVEHRVRDGQCTAPVRTTVGSLLSLPFVNATFDCVWSANVFQYFTEAQCAQAIEEFKRIVKPGGLVAIKDFDGTTMQCMPLDLGFYTRFMHAHMADSLKKGQLGVGCGLSLPGRLRRAGLVDIRRRGWHAERWAPTSAATRSFVTATETYFATVAADLDLTAEDKQLWRDVAANPATLFDAPDFCLRESFVTAIGRVPVVPN